MSPVRLEKQDSLAWLCLQRLRPITPSNKRWSASYWSACFNSDNESIKVVAITGEGSEVV